MRSRRCEIKSLMTHSRGVPATRLRSRGPSTACRRLRRWLSCHREILVGTRFYTHDQGRWEQIRTQDALSVPQSPFDQAIVLHGSRTSAISVSPCDYFTDYHVFWLRRAFIHAMRLLLISVGYKSNQGGKSCQRLVIVTDAYRVSTIADRTTARPDFFSVFPRNLAGKEASLG